MKNAPNKIYLQVGEDCECDIDFHNLSEVTWSVDKIFKTDLVFYRRSRKKKGLNGLDRVSRSNGKAKAKVS